MVYLKTTVGNNAHEDTQHDIIYKRDRRQFIYVDCVNTSYQISGGEGL